MGYAIILGTLFLIAGIVFYIIEILDIYLWGIATAAFVMSIMFGFWLGHPFIGVIVFILSIILATGAYMTRKKMHDF